MIGFITVRLDSEKREKKCRVNIFHIACYAPQSGGRGSLISMVGSSTDIECIESPSDLDEMIGVVMDGARNPNAT